MALSALRAALAVLVAAALLGVGLPAVEEAAASRAATAADANAGAVAAAVADLRRSDATAAAAPGARQAVELRFPGGVLAGRLDYIAVGGVPGETVRADGPNRDVVAYRLRGGEPRVAAVLPVDLRVAHDGTPGSDDDPLVVRGDATLVFRLVRDGRPVVHTFIRG